MKFLAVSILSLCLGVTSAPAQDSPKKKSGDSGHSGEPDSAPTKSVNDRPNNKLSKETSEELTEGPDTLGGRHPSAVSSIEPEELADFDRCPPQIQELIREGLALTKRNLTYTFGSADPSAGGMDCSGTICYLLSSLGIKGVPRQSDEICAWLQERTLLHRITGNVDSLSHHQFNALQPGDLVFWGGTYEPATPRNIPVTHVMVYLGKLKKNGKPVVFGASDGRSFQGEKRNGVSVFDFSLPRVTSASAFYGYGLIPTIGAVKVRQSPLGGNVVDAVAFSGSKAALPADQSTPKISAKGAQKSKPSLKQKAGTSKNQAGASYEKGAVKSSASSRQIPKKRASR